MAFDPANHDELATFRWAAAGLIKGLIRARAVQEPDFLKWEDYCRWKVEDCRSETKPCHAILSTVKLLQQKFEDKYIVAIEDNGLSVAHPDGSSNVEIHDLVHIVGGFIFGDLDDAIRVAKQREGKVQWNDLALWDELPQIRDALDKLPNPKPEANDSSSLEKSASCGIGQAKVTSNPKGTHEWKRTEPPTTRNYLKLPGEHLMKSLVEYLGISSKTVKSHDESGHIWVQQTGKRSFRVWVTSPDLYDFASNKLREAEEGNKEEEKGEIGS